MKVCFISFEYPPKVIGGMGTYAEQLVRGLDERGIDIYTVTRGDKACRDRKTYRVVTPNKLYWRRFYFIREAIGLFQKLNRLYKFDLVHLNGTYPIIRGFNLPTVSTLHAIPNLKQAAIGLKLSKSYKSVTDIKHLVLKNSVGSLFDVTIVQASDGIICPSPSLARDIVLYCFAHERKIHVIPNGIDLKTFDEIECFNSTLLNHYDIQKDNFILYVGRLSFLKGVQYLIEAFKIVQNQHPNLKLVIVGTGDFEDQLRKISRNVTGTLFLGHIESVRAKKLLYEASLAAVLPSSAYEVSPMSILESMASSKPVIASDVQGNSFMVQHGKNGFLSKPRDPVNLAKFINVLYEDRALRRRMGMLGRELVEKEFALDRMLSETLKVYDSISQRMF